MKLYHRTDDLNKESIIRNGLQTTYSNYWKGCGGCIYLSNIKDTGFGDIVFEITSVPDENKLSKISEWEYVYWGDIPPNMLL